MLRQAAFSDLISWEWAIGGCCSAAHFFEGATWQELLVSPSPPARMKLCTAVMDTSFRPRCTLSGEGG